VTSASLKAPTIRGDRLRHDGWDDRHEPSTAAAASAPLRLAERFTSRRSAQSFAIRVSPVVHAHNFCSLGTSACKYCSIASWNHRSSALFLLRLRFSIFAGQMDLPDNPLAVLEQFPFSRSRRRNRHDRRIARGAARARAVGLGAPSRRTGALARRPERDAGRSLDPPEGVVVDLPQIDAADLRPDQRVSPLIVMPLLLADATACTMDPSDVCPELPTGKR
jgi:hypothetical protein